ncbi:Bug family tripartite tricarboxylate transporter substrate binding protein [Pigmentiphaga litoralis]|uniref:Tripartite-type tricarboxylate transporter receptor subunit TctC n=1 Tax=Pigmentiphaga litoralis TaxID=516702 RepID=A0A7Y9IYD1_9BURK|nr:tripartite tricarboxylate transporter substrate binding protein [Pigmentiphaga litoralis]NYE26257.1 tripartite-type tricarboxylate transporter receptor subunit TctC [Pigmentiphaga litoralis]NYE85377.1 tripartite-type tricarboxylate transporter receptor subunit TctC [Pigmentiphaga litoralis]
MTHLPSLLPAVWPSTLRATFVALALPLAALPLAALTPAAQAQPAAFPSKPIRLVCAHAAGGAADQLSRIVSQQLSTTLGQPVVVENRPGASTMIAAEQVARSPADGYTLLMATVTTLSINPALYAKMRYDPIKDFAPISIVASTPFFLGVNAALPITSVRELVAAAKAAPGGLNYGSSGQGTSSHLAGELFTSMSNTQMVHVPYKATATRNTDLSAGSIQVVFGNDLLEFAKTGKVRILGVTSAQRLSGYPDIPTVAEAGGMPGYDASVWYGLVAPAGTPPAIVAKINDALRTAVADPAVRQQIMSTLGGDAVGSTPEAFASMIKSDRDKWTQVITRAHIKAEE